MFDKDLWTDFDFEERYPGRQELCRYFDHVDAKLRFSDRSTYNANVSGAQWSEKDREWTVEVKVDGKEVTSTCKWLIPAIGFAAKAYIPQIKGMRDFTGEIHHSAVSPTISASS